MQIWNLKHYVCSFNQCVHLSINYHICFLLILIKSTTTSSSRGSSSGGGFPNSVPYHNFLFWIWELSHKWSLHYITHYFYFRIQKFQNVCRDLQSPPDASPLSFREIVWEGEGVDRIRNFVRLQPRTAVLTLMLITFFAFGLVHTVFPFHTK
jgi:hypothetical protein